jgi:hypothetical protein
VRAFDRLAAARLEAPLVEAIRRSVVIAPEETQERQETEATEETGGSDRATRHQAPQLIRCPCGIRHDMRDILQALHGLPPRALASGLPFEVAVECAGRQMLVTLRGGRAVAVARHAAAQPRS